MLGTMMFSRLRRAAVQTRRTGDADTSAVSVCHISHRRPAGHGPWRSWRAFQGEAGTTSLTHGVCLVLSYSAAFFHRTGRGPPDTKHRRPAQLRLDGILADPRDGTVRIPGGQPAGICRTVRHHLPDLLPAELQVQEETSRRCGGVGCRFLPLRVALLSLFAQRKRKSNARRTGKYDDPDHWNRRRRGGRRSSTMSATQQLRIHVQ